MLRLVKINDAETLLEWRNDPITRNASHNPFEINQNEHTAWLSKTLDNDNRRLYIAEESTIPVGTIRADLFEGVWELSWTVSPKDRGRGVAKRMVALLANQISEPIRAEIKVGNIASERIAMHAGMKFSKEVDGVLHYNRGNHRI